MNTFENIYKKAIEGISLGVWSYSPSKKEIYLDDISRQYLTGKNEICSLDDFLTCILNKENETIFLTNLNQTCADKTAFKEIIQFKSNRKDGFWLEVSGNYDLQYNLIVGTLMDKSLEVISQSQLLWLQSFLEDTQQTAKIGAWEFSLNDNSLIWSDQVYLIHEIAQPLSMTVEKAIGFYYKDSRAKIEQAFEELITYGKQFDLELQLKTARENIIWVRSIGHAIYENGVITKVRGVFQDISAQVLRNETLEVQFLELKKLNSQLEHQKQELEKTSGEMALVLDKLEIKENDLSTQVRFLNAILSGTEYSIIATDPDGVITLFNKGAEDLLGYKAEELVGKETPSIIHDKHEVILRTQFLNDELGFSIKPGFLTFVIKSQHGTPDINEWTYITKTGERIPVLLSVTTLRNKQDEIKGYLGIARNISLDKLNEEKIKRLALVVEKTTNLVVITDPNGYIEWVNEAFQKTTGYDFAEVYGKKPGNILQGPETDRNTILEIRNAILKKKSIRTEILNYTKSGKKYWLEIIVEPVFDHAGQVMHFIAVESVIDSRKKQEIQIKEQKNQLDNILNSVTEVIWSVSAKDFLLQFITPSVNELIGYNTEEVIGKELIWHTHVHPEDINLISNFKETLYELESWHQKYRVITKSGEVKWISDKAKILKDSFGVPVFVNGILRDITSEINFAEKLQRQYEILDFVYTVNHEFLIGTDNTLLFNSMLDKLLVFLGAEYGFIGEVFYDENDQPFLQSNAISDISWNEETAALYQKHLKSGMRFHNLKTLFGLVMQENSVVISNDPTLDSRSNGLPHGHPPLKKFMGIPVNSSDGKLIGMLGVANKKSDFTQDDVDELKPFVATYATIIQSLRIQQRNQIAEKTLFEERQRLAGIIEGTNIATWEWNVQTGETIINERWAEIIGYTLEELQPVTIQTWIDFAHPEDYNRSNGVLSKCFKGEIVFYDFEFRMKHKDGHWVWLHDRGKVVTRDEHGRAVLMLGTHADISARKEQEFILKENSELIKEQNKRLLNFAHIVSHNLRSHAGNFKMILDVLESETNEEERNDLFKLLKQNSVNLLETLGNLHEVVKIQDNIDQKTTSLNVKSYISKSLLSITEIIKTEHAVVKIDDSCDSEVDFNDAYFESIILNFLTNAIKYKHPDRNPEIQFKVLHEQYYHVLQISDNGLGIDLALHGHKIFGMYKTFHNNQDARGIGLFITKNQVESLGGKIEVESEVNKGTMFKVYIKK